MPLVPTEEGVVKTKNRGLSKILRRSNTVSDENCSTSQRSKQPLRKHASQSLDELVRCAICLEQLRRPTMLPCQHTFCLACLQNYVQKQSTVIACPTCRLQVTLPVEGINALPTNILLQAFLESLKPASGNSGNLLTKHLAKDNTSSGKINAASSANLTEKTGCFRCFCGGSPGKEVKCQHCNEFFCNSCHLLHTTELKSDWANVIDELFAENQRLSMIKEDSKARCKKLRDNIQATTAIQVQQLLEKQDQLLEELRTWRKKEIARLAQVQQLCEEVLAQTPSIGSSDEEPVPNADVLKRSEAILQTARLCGTARLMFDSEELSLTCESTETDAKTGACVTPTSLVAPASTTAATPTVLHASVQSDPLTHGRKSRRVTFTGFSNESHLTSSLESPSIEAKKPFESSVTAEEQSLHYRSLSGHPRQRITSSLLQRPAGVAVSPWTGDIYVAATDSHRVYVMDKSGKIVKSLGSPYRSNSSLGGSGNGGHSSHGTLATASNANCGTFLCPFGIAFSTSAEEIYVTDKWLNCIQVFNKDGVYERQIGVKGTSPGHFRSPEGIAVDSKGYIYVCDTCNDRVQVLDRNGVYIRELGAVSQMTLPGGKLYQKREFSEPTGVAVSPDGSRVAICDFGNCRIKVFGPNGELIVVFGFRGTQRGQFQQPECLAVDDKGFILVGDNGNGRIQIFRPNGNFVRSLGTKGGGPGQFNWISGLTLSKDMDIIATDFKNHCIQIF